MENRENDGPREVSFLSPVPYPAIALYLLPISHADYKLWAQGLSGDLVLAPCRALSSWPENVCLTNQFPSLFLIQ